MPDDDRDLDKFYTAPHIADMCFSFMMKVAKKDKILSPEVFVEPSAGAGAFVDALKTEGRVIAMDIKPERSDITQQDFLIWESNGKGKIWTIGNPPFGKNGSLAIRFLNRSSNFSEVVAMIFPRTFRKHSVQKRINPHLHLIGELILPDQSFTLGGKPVSVPSVFQVWHKKSEMRISPPIKTSHQDFKFVSPDVADFLIQRVGVRAGTVKPVAVTHSPSSHLGVRAVDRDSVEEIKQIFEKLDYDSVKWDTAGNPSISKSEIVSLYEKDIMGDETRP